MTEAERTPTPPTPRSPSTPSPPTSAGVLDPLVIVGPTASGKSALAVTLASAVGNVEIVSADAKAVYRGMDIGTAKPSVAERGGIEHHLIDVVDPSEEYTVARFQVEVAAVLAGIEGRGAAAIIVGGTGLYVRAVVDDFDMPGQYPEALAEVEAESSSERLWHRLEKLDPTAAAKMLPTNRRRVVRALEVTIGSGRPFSGFGPGVDKYPPTRFHQIGLKLDRDDLDRRIDERYDAQLVRGFVDEVRSLSASPLSRTAAQALGYRELLQHLAGEMTLDEAVDEAKRRTRRFARRQERWFRRDPRLAWFGAREPDLARQVEDWWRNSAVGR